MSTLTGSVLHRDIHLLCENLVPQMLGFDVGTFGIPCIYFTTELQPFLKEPAVH